MLAVPEGGFLEFFLTTNDKQTFSEYDKQETDKSITNRLLSPLWDTIAARIPHTIAPNSLSLAGVLCVVQAWYLTELYSESSPKVVVLACIILVSVFYILHSVTGRHALNMRQDTPVGELFKYVCDGIATVFLMVVLGNICGATSVATHWYVVQTAQLVMFWKHVSAFLREEGLRYRLLNGPGEAITALLVLLLVKGAVGLEWAIQLYEHTWGMVVKTLVQHAHDDHGELIMRVAGSPAWGAEVCQNAYIIVMAVCIIRLLLFPKRHSQSQWLLLCCMCIRLTPAVGFYFSAHYPYESTMLEVLVDGLFMTVIVSDMVVARMAGRELHSWILLMCMASVFNHMFTVFMVFGYYFTIFADICFYMNLPLMSVCRNVYCDGVYDLCHLGHKNAFKNALKFGNRLFVGVCNDEECSVYKRPPIMRHHERCAEVEACKSVTKVIPNAPTFGLTKEFLDKHKIHVVACGEEYYEKFPDPKDDKYYGVPRMMGICRPTARSEGISTSDIIKRVQSATLEKNES